MVRAGKDAREGAFIAARLGAGEEAIDIVHGAVPRAPEVWCGELLVWNERYCRDRHLGGDEMPPTWSRLWPPRANAATGARPSRPSVVAAGSIEVSSPLCRRGLRRRRHGTRPKPAPRGSDLEERVRGLDSSQVVEGWYALAYESAFAAGEPLFVRERARLTVSCGRWRALAGDSRPMLRTRLGGAHVKVTSWRTRAIQTPNRARRPRQLDPGRTREFADRMRAVGLAL